MFYDYPPLKRWANLFDPTLFKYGGQCATGAEQPYFVVGSSCADVASNSLKKLGINPGYAENYTVEPGLAVPSTSMSAVPNVRYRQIKFHNKGNGNHEIQLKPSAGRQEYYRNKAQENHRIRMREKSRKRG